MLEFLGLEIDSLNMKVEVPNEKVEKDQETMPISIFVRKSLSEGLSTINGGDSPLRQWQLCQHLYSKLKVSP